MTTQTFDPSLPPAAEPVPFTTAVHGPHTFDLERDQYRVTVMVTAPSGGRVVSSETTVTTELLLGMDPRFYYALARDIAIGLSGGNFTGLMDHYVRCMASDARSRSGVQPELTPENTCATIPASESPSDS